ncbi:MAG: histidine kinase, partial [Phaeodactylibacter sp.]|nr:histidine kinase [Phaeodactylibacter sp.]
MALRRINELFPLRKLLYLLLAIAIGVQLIVISFNHYTGFYVLEGLNHFLWRFARGVILSLAAGFIMAIPALLVMRFLNHSFPWKERAPQRILLQLGLTVLVALAVSTLTTLALHSLRPYKEPLDKVLAYNALIFSVANIILAAILEGMLFFSRGDAAEQKAKALEKELSQIRFEVLKSQINPHFMFNSLNVLSGLIDKDVNKAQQFIDEFSLIYRYVLETIEKPVVTLNDELQFVRSYVFLQQMRYGEALEVEVNLPA